MAYRLTQFGDLELTPYLQRGDSQDFGTGSALTNFMQLPGGGFYDNYRSRKSPQGIRPLNKTCILWGTAEELRIQLDDLRAKIGVRERLTVEFDDGSQRWQWARLQDVSAPRPAEAKGGWLPVSLTWITAAQNWRGIQRPPDGWTWGDGTWTFGDGSAAFGEGGETFALTSADQTVTVTHEGSIDAPNVTLLFEMTGTWQDVTIINETNGCMIKIDRASSDTLPWLEINAGARSLYTGGVPSTIASIIRDVFASTGNSIYATVTGSHGLATGDAMRVDGTGIYDGDYYPVSFETYAQVRASFIPHFEGYGEVTTGTLRKLTNTYPDAVFSDRNRWFVLSPGENVIRVIWSPFPSTVSFRVGYDDHYA